MSEERDTRSGAERIADERRRQVGAEGYTAEHDDDHNLGQLAMAAACYAAPKPLYELREHNGSKVFRDPWPWARLFDTRIDKPSVDARIRLLEKAGALIAAEIDRLLRKKWTT